MTSRIKSQQKPYWKRRVKQTPGYIREYAYDDEGNPVMEENYYVVKNADGTLTYDKEHQVWRERPNRAMVRDIAARMRKDEKNSVD